MQEQLINFTTAKLAKELGFDINNDIYHFEELKIIGVFPTQSLLQKWLRDTFSIHVEVEVSHPSTRSIRIRYNSVVISDLLVPIEVTQVTEFFKTYEKALDEGLLDALKFLKTCIDDGRIKSQG